MCCSPRYLSKYNKREVSDKMPLNVLYAKPRRYRKIGLEIKYGDHLKLKPTGRSHQAINNVHPGNWIEIMSAEYPQ